MPLSKESRAVSAILLLTIPTIIYGGTALLGILTSGAAGSTSGEVALNDTQWALWRAGHAHAGVLVILSLLIQPLVDYCALGKLSRWVARLGAPIAAILISAGFFGLAFIPTFKWLLYIGAASLTASLLSCGIGLIRGLRQADPLGA